MFISWTYFYSSFYNDTCNQVLCRNSLVFFWGSLLPSCNSSFWIPHSQIGPIVNYYPMQIHNDLGARPSNLEIYGNYIGTVSFKDACQTFKFYKSIWDQFDLVCGGLCRSVIPLPAGYMMREVVKCFVSMCCILLACIEWIFEQIFIVKITGYSIQCIVIDVLF